MAEALYPCTFSRRIEEELMNYNRPVRNDSAITIKVMCAVVFVAFSFLWIYFFQADVLAVTQHVLSDGKTAYNRLVGAVIITLVLFLLQLGINKVLKLNNRAHSLTYFPSMLIMAILTSGGGTFWYWLAPLLLVLWGLLVSVLRKQRLNVLRADFGLFSKMMWQEMLVMALMMVGIALLSNTNAVYHYRAHVESCLQCRDFDKALATGVRSLETDESLMMLRAYALSRKGELGERLFEYPIVGSGADLIPVNGGRSALLLYPQDSVYRHLGAIPRSYMDAPAFLKAVQRSGQATQAIHDYVLCGQLIDRDIDAFAHSIGRYYNVADSITLPRHYREALVLYAHLRSHPYVVYHHPVTDEDYDNLVELEAQYSDPQERKVRVMEKYNGSYWYYYKYR